jgi:hypothetical protein
MEMKVLMVVRIFLTTVARSYPWVDVALEEKTDRMGH